MLNKTLILLTVLATAACAPRYCDQHYSNTCKSADIAKQRVWGNINHKYDPVTEIIAKDIVKQDLQKVATGKPLGAQ